MTGPGLGGQHQQVARLIRRQVERGAPCALCGLPIDLTLPPRTRWSFSVDHIDPRSRGGQSTLANSRPAHYGCNSARGNRTTRRSQRQTRRW